MHEVMQLISSSSMHVIQYKLPQLVLTEDDDNAWSYATYVFVKYATNSIWIIAARATGGMRWKFEIKVVLENKEIEPKKSSCSYWKKSACC